MKIIFHTLFCRRLLERPAERGYGRPGSASLSVLTAPVVLVLLLAPSSLSSAPQQTLTSPEEENPIVQLAAQMLAHRITRNNAIQEIHNLADHQQLTAASLELSQLREAVRKITNDAKADEVIADLLCEAYPLLGSTDEQLLPALLLYAVSVSNPDASATLLAEDRLTTAITLSGFAKLPPKIQAISVKLLSHFVDLNPWSSTKREYLKNALELSLSALPQKSDQARGLIEVQLARLYQLLKDKDKLRLVAPLLTQALETFTLESDPLEYAQIQANLGYFYASQASGEEASDRQRDAISAFHSALKGLAIKSDSDLNAYVNLHLGQSLLALSMEKEALGALQIAANYYSTSATASESYEALFTLCQAYTEYSEGNKTNNLLRAASFCKEALSTLTSESPPQNRARVLLELGSIYGGLAQIIPAEALRSKQFFDDAVSALDKIKNPREYALALSYRSLAMLDVNTGSNDNEISISHTDQIADLENAFGILKSEDNDIRALLALQIGLARLSRRETPEELLETINFLTTAQKLSREAHNVTSEAYSFLNLGRALVKAGRRSEAQVALDQAFHLAYQEVRYRLTGDWSSLAEVVERAASESADEAIKNNDNLLAFVQLEAGQSILLSTMEIFENQKCHDPTCKALLVAAQELRDARKDMAAAIIFANALNEGAAEPARVQRLARLEKAQRAFESARASASLQFQELEDSQGLSETELQELAASEPDTAFLEFSLIPDRAFALLLNANFGKQPARAIPLTSLGHLDAISSLRSIAYDDSEIVRGLLAVSTGNKPREVDSADVDRSHVEIPDLIKSLRLKEHLKWEEAFWYWHFADAIGDLPPPRGMAVDDWPAATQAYSNEAFRRFDVALNETADAMDAVIGRSVKAILADVGVRRLVIIRNRDMASWPFTALPSFSDLIVSYTPNIKTYIRNKKAAGERNEPVIRKVIANPTNDLPCASVEGRLVESVSRGALQTLYRERATVEAALAMLTGGAGTRRDEWFISAHGTYDPRTPDKSGLLLSDRLLRVDELFAGNWPNTRLAVISGCETALGSSGGASNWTLSLPAVLTTAGIPRVIASTWRVDELATLLLISRFVELYPKYDEAEALHLAQEWLRTLTAGRALARLQDIIARSGEDSDVEYCIGYASTRLNSYNEDDLPFLHPYYWAGFELYK